ncbi:hypothetical protein L1887_60198 [Cichorium endivia]|nr:hypothetical protein L1887_60198 [Cichorium endivia]
MGCSFCGRTISLLCAGIQTRQGLTNKVRSIPEWIVRGVYAPEPEATDQGSTVPLCPKAFAPERVKDWQSMKGHKAVASASQRPIAHRPTALMVDEAAVGNRAAILRKEARDQRRDLAVACDRIQEEMRCAAVDLLVFGQVLSDVEPNVHERIASVEDQIESFVSIAVPFVPAVQRDVSADCCRIDGHDVDVPKDGGGPNHAAARSSARWAAYLAFEGSDRSSGSAGGPIGLGLGAVVARGRALLRRGRCAGRLRCSSTASWSPFRLSERQIGPIGSFKDVVPSALKQEEVVGAEVDGNKAEQRADAHSASGVAHLESRKLRDPIHEKRRPKKKSQSDPRETSTEKTSQSDPRETSIAVAAHTSATLLLFILNCNSNILAINREASLLKAKMEATRLDSQQGAMTYTMRS